MQNSQPDLSELYKNFAKSVELYNQIIKEFPINDNAPKDFDPLNINPTIMDAFGALSKEPEAVFSHSMKFYENMSNLWMGMAKQFFDKSIEVPASSDKRFNAPDWEELPAFKFIKETYLMYSDWMQGLVHNIKGIEGKEKEKLEFYTKQYLDAASPANFPWTNPEVMKKMMETNGENLVNGLTNLANDLKTGKISQTDFGAFELGKNLALTPGKVIFQNDLMQLIQYEPSTEKVYQTPILFVPAWINKFYIADLRPDNSLMKWLVDQGYTVFVVSWVNPSEKLRDKNFENYLFEGPLAAIEQIQKITGEKQINAIGYCLGGTLLATALSYLESQGKKPVRAATFLTTMLDFADPGEISVFIDEGQIADVEKRMNKVGYLDGKEMAMTFNMLRSNDLIWSFVINNYLLGKTPYAFDLLYWNADSTRMPAAMHSFYLRNMYLNNKLREKGGVKIKDTPIDLRNISTPAYFLATKKDHIAPWKTTYLSAKILKNATFMLTDSGHVAGVVNPPGGTKYHHWVNDKLPQTAEEWIEKCEEVQGSWWPTWHKWNINYSGDKVPARDPGKGIEAAPGSYVKVRS